MNRYIIAENGRSPYHIVTSQYAHDAVRFAASELQKYIYESTNACIPYFSDGCPRRGAEIMVGMGARGISLPLDHLSDEGFFIKTDGENIIIAGKTPRGTLYGVYSFLEKFVGFRCFTKNIEKVDRLKTLAVPDLDIAESPAFEYREAYFRDAFDADFCAKNKLNSNMADLPRSRGGHMKFFNFHHSFNDLVPVDEYFDSHPEYFSEVEGKRIGGRTQLCLTNPDVLKISIEKVREWIRKNPHCRVFSVGQNDWRNNCTCPECREIDDREGSPAGTVISFVNKIAENIEKDYPDVLLHTFAYVYSRKAPKHIKPHKNVIVRLCNIECSWSEPISTLAAKNPKSEAAGFLEEIKDWSKICSHLYIWDYSVNFRNYLQPFPNFYSMAENIKLYRDNNVKGVLEQGNFAFGGGSALIDLKAYLIAKLLWNPDVDVDAIIDEFLAYCYKGGEKYINEYIKLWTEAVKGNDLTIYQYSDADYITDDLVNESEKLFIKAMENAENEEIKRRIEKEFLSIRYLKISRMPLGAPDRDKLIDRLYEDVKSFKLTEVSERTNLEIYFEWMKSSRYVKERHGRWNLYYIMK